MFLATKLFILFCLIGSSIAKHIPDQDSEEEQDRDVCMSATIDYCRYFKKMIEGWIRETNERYPFWKNTNHKGYLDRSFILQRKAQDYVEQWNKWKRYSGYPYRDLRNKIGVLWPHQGDNCPEFEATNLLIYMIHGLTSPYDFTLSP
ncbi:unnamed protein product [Thlaspi arvense]|uniref:Uncharacterized protein n=1 Tax=Thlaspi arvense TaxID=13288 RepID=A0AAU9T4H7_THLAR|nr:unnamed protein product [Thlaspi arvense]